MLSAALDEQRLYAPRRGHLIPLAEDDHFERLAFVAVERSPRTLPVTPFPATA